MFFVALTQFSARHGINEKVNGGDKATIVLIIHHEPFIEGMLDVPPNDHGSTFKIALEDLPIWSEPLLQKSTPRGNATALCAAKVLSLAALRLISRTNSSILIGSWPPTLDNRLWRH